MCFNTGCELNIVKATPHFTVHTYRGPRTAAVVDAAWSVGPHKLQPSHPSVLQCQFGLSEERDSCPTLRHAGLQMSSTDGALTSSLGLSASGSSNVQTLPQRLSVPATSATAAISVPGLPGHASALTHTSSVSSDSSRMSPYASQSILATTTLNNQPGLDPVAWPVQALAKATCPDMDSQLLQLAGPWANISAGVEKLEGSLGAATSASSLGQVMAHRANDAYVSADQGGGSRAAASISSHVPYAVPVGMLTTPLAGQYENQSASFGLPSGEGAGLDDTLTALLQQLSAAMPPTQAAVTPQPDQQLTSLLSTLMLPCSPAAPAPGRSAEGRAQAQPPNGQP
ncbi:hypothetical protein HaLaN_23498, partial [Haematococcus lacustris]